MRELTLENVTALLGRQLLARDFISIYARNRDTGIIEHVGFWSDIENVTAQVINPNTATLDNRAFYGAGGLISIDDIPSTSTLQVEEVQITLSQLDEIVEQAVRLYEVKQAEIQIFRGMFDPESRKMVSPAFPRYVGFINNVSIETAPENESGSVKVSCVSHTQELVRSNPATRSHEDQKSSRSGDMFFVDAAAVPEWQMSWGERQQDKVDKKPGIFGWGNFLGFL